MWTPLNLRWILANLGAIALWASLTLSASAANDVYAPAKADDYPTFKIESPEVLTLVGLSESDTKINYDSSAKKVMSLIGFLPANKSRFSYNQLRPKLDELRRTDDFEAFVLKLAETFDGVGVVPGVNYEGAKAVMERWQKMAGLIKG